MQQVLASNDSKNTLNTFYQPLFPWLLLRLKPTMENKYLVTTKNLIHMGGP